MNKASLAQGHIYSFSLVFSWFVLRGRGERSAEAARPMRPQRTTWSLTEEVCQLLNEPIMIHTQTTEFQHGPQNAYAGSSRAWRVLSTRHVTHRSRGPHTGMLQVLGPHTQMGQVSGAPTQGWGRSRGPQKRMGQVSGGPTHDGAGLGGPTQGWGRSEGVPRTS